MARKKKSRTKNKKRNIAPNLKSASGSGFSFEDKVAALLFCEMLAGKSSLGDDCGLTVSIERQAGDWEPFGDLLLILPTRDGTLVKCGCSVKSNRQITANGCKADLRVNLWAMPAKPVFDPDGSALGLFCAELVKKDSDLAHSLCRQAREVEPARLDQKVMQTNMRRIYDSFRCPTLAGVDGLPGHILRHFVLREFDFENVTSRCEADALRLCREILRPEDSTEEASRNLWKELLSIAEGLRIAGGSITRARLAAKLRITFRLRDDPSDVAAWTRIRALSREWMEQIKTKLPGGITLPRAREMQALQTELDQSRALHVIGESGLGKSALIKMLAVQAAANGTEVVWIKAEQFNQLLEAAPDFVEIALRSRCAWTLIVFDAMEGCYSADGLSKIAQAIAALTVDVESPSRIVLVSQTQEWDRVSRGLVKNLVGHPSLSRRVECGELSGEDLKLVYVASPSVARLAAQGHLTRLLASPKILDVLLTGQLAEDRSLAGEADLVDWWWEQKVRGSKHLAAEENIACQLASRMADELTSEVPPDAVNAAEDAANTLLQRGVLRRTQDRRLRFDHDLFADWSRVMHLRSLGDDALTFMRTHTENPPWLRAIRLLSQHLLERTAELERWRTVIASCSAITTDKKEPAAERLQVLDAWLEGIAYCADPNRVLKSIRADLLSQNGWLLKRFVRRLLHVGTLPDPIFQERFRQVDADMAEPAAMLYRLPRQILWTPLLDFLIANQEDATAFLPVEVAEIGAMWARLEEYLKLRWPALAQLILLNAEKELRREVAGEYRRDSGPRSIGGDDKSRVSIYSVALEAASQIPDQAAKLALKAAGRAPWEDGDLSNQSDRRWRGEWFEDSFDGHRAYLKSPPESWPDGPSRLGSRDFFRAWFESTAPLALYRSHPAVACEATLAFLLEWPKAKIRDDHHHTDRRGFTFQAINMYPAFWTKGPFLIFLRENWCPALELIIKLTNFATDRYAEWWPYQPGVEDVTFATPNGKVSWRGTHQVYTWHRYHMNTVEAVTCALMALEKWLSERLDRDESIADAIQLLFAKGHSLAFAGVLISLVKRWPNLFLSELKPLLFMRKLYVFDEQAVINESAVAFGWFRDPAVINKLRSEWNQVPGRRTGLREACYQWLVERPEFSSLFAEVAAAWRQEADNLPAESEDRRVLLRWACGFDRSMWKQVVLPNGQTGWQNERPEELRDHTAEQALARRQILLALPMQCTELLQKRQNLTDEQADYIWGMLRTWDEFEKDEAPDKDDWLWDHRHGKAGLLMLLLCLADNWLSKYPERRCEIQTEVRQLLSDPPKIKAFSPDEQHDDGEAFLARCVVRYWAGDPKSEEWRAYLGRFVTAYRYRTVQVMFDEAFRVRSELGAAYRELEALTLSWAATRETANRSSYYQPDRVIMDKWMRKWLPTFAKGRGPKWPKSWATVAAPEPFRKPDKHPKDVSKRKAKIGIHYSRRTVYRRGYGFDMGVVLAAFGHFPPLAEARNRSEEEHWLTTCKEILNIFLRTLPATTNNDNEEWNYDVWTPDQNIFDIIAARVFECTHEKRAELWQPILNLPPAAHHHITGFLDALLLQSMHKDPARIDQLSAIWQEIAEYLFASPKWAASHARGCHEVWRQIFLYGTPFPSVREEIFGPFVDGLRALFERHARTLAQDADEQSSFVWFLTTKAGERLLVDAFVWLHPSWEQAGVWFWKIAVERSHFSQLLEHAWRRHFPNIRKNPEALKAFKTLTLKLAAQQVPIALEVQQQIGS